MPRYPDSGRLDLAQVFRRAQTQLLAQLDLSHNFEHPTAAGLASELLWADLLNTYLPKRFHASPAFIVNSEGYRSRQIDLAIYDHLTTTLLFPHEAGTHIPIESVYAVFEVKASLSPQWIRDAAVKAASVRQLGKPSITAGILATTSVWNPKNFSRNLRPALADLSQPERLTYGCALEHGAFITQRKLTVSTPDQALITFLLGLIAHLNRKPPYPKPDLLNYLNNAA
jgi:hypothetical protein